MSNPAVRNGFSGLLASFSQQLEAKALHEFMERTDARLNEVLTNQRNDTIAEIQTAADQIDEALSLLDADGDPQTIWELVRTTDERIINVQNKALNNLGALAEEVQRANSNSEPNKVSQEVQGKINLWLNVLAYCFELKDKFNVIELDHVMMTAPEKSEGHRRGLAENRERRVHNVIGKTRSVLAALEDAGALGRSRTIIYPRLAKRPIGAINNTGNDIASFHRLLGDSLEFRELETLPWSEAWKDRDQEKVDAITASAGAVTVGIAGAVKKVGVEAVKKVGVAAVKRFFRL